VSAQPSEHARGRRRRSRLFPKRLLGYHQDAVHEAIDAKDAAVREAGERAAAAQEQLAAERAELEAQRAEAAWATRRIEELDLVSARLATMVIDRDQELRRVRAELREALERDDEAVRALVAIGEHLEMIRRQAGSQATRIRLRALREAAELAQRVGDLEGAEGDAREGPLRRLDEALERVGADLDAEEEELAGRAQANGHAQREAGELFDGLVEVDVGPLSDFSQLVGFEDAASEIGASSEISVKRFTQGRATLAMRFKHPVELLRELEERAPFEFRVRDTRSNRIVLDLDE
jgi:DNA repair exonuclease SbcCD ATPase subunit